MSAQVEIWVIIIGLGIGTYLIRFSFFGIIGDRPIPIWFERALKYVGVAILPGLIAPLVLWPEVTGGAIEPARLLAALAALGAGFYTRNVLWAILAGFGVLYTMIFIFGQFG